MSLSQPMTWKDNADANTVFNLQSLQGTTSRYIDVASTTTEPRGIRVSHEVVTSKKDGVTTDRHLIGLSDTQLETDGSSGTCQVNLTMVLPRKPSLSTTNLFHLVHILLDMITTGTAPTLDTTGVLAQILRGES